MEVKPEHIVAQFKRAWLFTKVDVTYRVCGEVIVTPNYIFARGHGSHDDYDETNGLCIPREDIDSIEDMSHTTCDIHDEMAEENNISTPPTTVGTPAITEGFLG